MSILYQPQYRVHGTSTWINWGSPTANTSITIGANPGPALSPLTQYDFQVVATNAVGSTTLSSITATTSSATSIQSIALSPQTFTVGGTAGTIVGAITVTMSSGTFSGALQVTGTDAAFFQITGGNLTLSSTVTNTARAYNINIVATQAGVSTFTQNFSTITGTTTITSPTFSSPPLAAQEVGMTKQVFFGDFVSTSEYSTSTTSLSGATLYKSTFSTVAAATVQPTWTAATIGTQYGNNGTAGPNASPNGGIIQLLSGASGVGDFYSFPHGYLNNGASSVMVPVGNGNWNHCYMEMYMQFDTMGNTQQFTSQSFWPDWWSWEMQSLYGLGLGDALPTIYHQPGSELDFWECTGGLSFNPGVNTEGLFQAADHGSGSLGGSARLGTDKNWHTWGFRWSPNAATGLGNWDCYLDNTATTAGTHYATGQSAAQNETGAFGPETRFMIFSTGLNWPLNIDWIRVWTA